MPHSAPDSARVAMVTGGSRGLGRATAARLARDGYRVVINYAGNEDAARDAVAEIENTGGRVISVRGDVADEHDMAAVFRAAEDTFGGLDVVVHAAGRMILSPLADFEFPAVDEVLRTNVRGTFVVGQQARERSGPVDPSCSSRRPWSAASCPATPSTPAAKGRWRQPRSSSLTRCGAVTCR